jgi:hypothetical protein
MKSKILISVFFLLTTCFSFSQVPTQQWLTVINDSTPTNDIFSNNFAQLKGSFPLKFNNSFSKIALSNNSNNQPVTSSLNTTDGSIVFSSIDNTPSNSRDLAFDQNDNIYNISENSTTGYISKRDSTGNLLNSITINGGCQNNLLSCESVNDKIYIYNRQKNCNNQYASHIIYSLDTNLSQNWNQASTDTDWYYSQYSGRMITDNDGNIIVTSKKQTSSSQYPSHNTYDIVIRKINSSGQVIWQTVYDFSSKMDMIADSYSLKVDENNDIYFVSTNSSNWNNATFRLVKINGQNGSIIYQQQLPSPVIHAGQILIVGGNLIINNYDKLHCLNSSNGSLLWSQSVSNINTISINNQNNILATSENSVILLDTLGNTLYNLNVSIPGYTVKHLHTISDSVGNIFVVGYKTINDINKVFISKFSTCTGFVNAGQDLTICEGEDVTLSASGSSNFTWSDNVQNGVAFSPQTTHTYFVSVPGCSIDSLTVTVNQKPQLTSGSDITTCRGSFINLDGQNYFSQNGLSFNWSNGVQNGVDFQATNTTTYVVTATTPSGCLNTDSVTVTVNYASDTVISTTVCESYTLNGETYTESGVYTQYLINSFGCDSVIVLKISINHTPSTPILSVEDDRITTPLQSGVDFVWVRCPDNTPVNSEVGSVTTNDVVSVLTPYFSGSYSVIATNECGSVQSDCQNIEINTANIDENVDIELNVFPNPTQDFIQIDGLQNVSNFKLFDSNGKLVLSGDVDNKQLIDLSSLNKGTYQLIVNSKSLRIVRI